MAVELTDEQWELLQAFAYKATNYSKDSDETNFIIPFVAMNDGKTPAQIRTQNRGLYKDIQRAPFIRKTGVFDEHNSIPDIDISPLVYYGTLEQSKIAPTLENVDIKLYYREPNLKKVKDKLGALTDGSFADTYIWREIPVGFHVYNNDTVYGYEWLILQSDYVDTDGIYNLHMNIEDGLGVCKFAGTQAPINLAGVQYKIIITAKNLWTREFSLLDSMPLLHSLTGRSDDLAPTVNAVREFYEKALETLKVLTETLFVGTTDASTGETTYGLTFNKDEGWARKLGIGDITDVNKFLHDTYDELTKHETTYVDNVIVDEAGNVIGVHGIVNAGAKGNLDAKSLAGAQLSNGQQAQADNVGKLSYIPYVDDSNQIGLGTVTRYFARAANKDPNLIFRTTLNTTTDTLLNIRNTDITTVDSYLEQTRVGSTILNLRFGVDKKPILRITEGQNEDGAATLQVANLKVGTIDFGKDLILNPDIVLNYIFDGSSISYKNPISELLGINLKTFEDSRFEVLKPNLEVDADGNELLDLHTATMEDENLTVASRKTNGTLDKLGSALQAIYELPMSTWRYKRGQEEFKDQIGILIERVNQYRDNMKTWKGVKGENTDGTPTSDNILVHKRNTLLKSSNTNIRNATDGVGVVSEERVQNNAYTYTDPEITSMEHYFDLMTSKKELNQEIRNTVGILLKAAKETQERLLDIETAVYGWDSKTIPGSDNYRENFINEHIAKELQDQLNNNALLLGLNRLMRAVLLELYDTTDLEQIDAEVESRITDSDSLGAKVSIKSRMDQVDEITNVLYSQLSAMIRFYMENIQNDEIGHTYTDIVNRFNVQKITDEALSEDTEAASALLDNVLDDHSETTDRDKGRTWKNLPSTTDVTDEAKNAVGFVEVAASAHKHTPNKDESGVVRVPSTVKNSSIYYADYDTGKKDKETGEPVLERYIFDSATEYGKYKVGDKLWIDGTAYTISKLNSVYEDRSVTEGTSEHSDVTDFDGTDGTTVTRRDFNLFKLDKNKAESTDDFAAIGTYKPYFKSKAVAWDSAKLERVNKKLSEVTKTIYGTDDVTMKYPNRTEVLRRNITNLIDDLYPNRAFNVENAFFVKNDATADFRLPFKTSKNQSPGTQAVALPVVDEPVSRSHTSIITWFDNEIFNFNVVNNYIGQILKSSNSFDDYLGNKQINLDHLNRRIVFDTAKLLTDRDVFDTNTYGTYYKAYSRLDMLENLLGVKDCYITDLYADVDGILAINNETVPNLDKPAQGLSAEIANYRKSLTVMQDEVYAREDLIISYKTQVLKLQEDVENYQEQIQKLVDERNLINLEGASAEEQQQLLDLSTKIENLSGDVAQLNKDLTNIESQLATANDVKDWLDSTIEELTDQYNQYTETLRDLKESLDSEVSNKALATAMNDIANVWNADIVHAYVENTLKPTVAIKDVFDQLGFETNSLGIRKFLQGSGESSFRTTFDETGSALNNETQMVDSGTRDAEGQIVYGQELLPADMFTLTVQDQISKIDPNVSGNEEKEDNYPLQTEDKSNIIETGTLIKGLTVVNSAYYQPTWTIENDQFVETNDKIHKLYKDVDCTEVLIEDDIKYKEVPDGTKEVIESTTNNVYKVGSTYNTIQTNLNDSYTEYAFNIELFDCVITDEAGQPVQDVTVQTDEKPTTWAEAVFEGDEDNAAGYQPVSEVRIVKTITRTTTLDGGIDENGNPIQNTVTASYTVTYQLKADLFKKDDKLYTKETTRSNEYIPVEIDTTWHIIEDNSVKGEVPTNFSTQYPDLEIPTEFWRSISFGRTETVLKTVIDEDATISKFTILADTDMYTVDRTSQDVTVNVDLNNDGVPDSTSTAKLVAVRQLVNAVILIPIANKKLDIDVEKVENPEGLYLYAPNSATLYTVKWDVESVKGTLTQISDWYDYTFTGVEIFKDPNNTVDISSIAADLTNLVKVTGLTAYYRLGTKYFGYTLNYTRSYNIHWFWDETIKSGLQPKAQTEPRISDKAQFDGLITFVWRNSFKIPNGLNIEDSVTFDTNSLVSVNLEIANTPVTVNITTQTERINTVLDAAATYASELVRSLYESETGDGNNTQNLYNSTVTTLETIQTKIDQYNGNLANLQADENTYVEEVVNTNTTIVDSSHPNATLTVVTGSIKYLESQKAIKTAERETKNTELAEAEAQYTNLQSIVNTKIAEAGYFNSQVDEKNNQIVALEQTVLDIQSTIKSIAGASDVTKLLTDSHPIDYSKFTKEPNDVDYDSCLITVLCNEITTLRADITRTNNLIETLTAQAKAAGAADVLPYYATELDFINFVATKGFTGSVNYSDEPSEDLLSSTNVGFVLSRKSKTIQERITTTEAFLDIFAKGFNYNKNLLSTDGVDQNEKANNGTINPNKRFEAVDVWTSLKRLFDKAENKKHDPRIFDLDLSESYDNLYDHNRKVWQFVENSRGAVKSVFVATISNATYVGNYQITNVELAVDPTLLPFQDSTYLSGWKKFTKATITVQYVRSGKTISNPDKKTIYLKGKTPISALGNYYGSANKDAASTLLNADGWQNQTEYNVYKTISNLFTSLLNGGLTSTLSNKTQNANNLYYQLMLLMRPVGSIYMSVSATNPADIFGGTWEAIQDRFLIGVGTGTSVKTTKPGSNGGTGGSFTHTLSIANLPKHTHSKGTYNITGSFYSDCFRGLGLSGAFYDGAYVGRNDGWDGWVNMYRVSFSASRSWTGNSGETGSNQAFDITPPYYGVYIWRRTGA